MTRTKVISGLVVLFLLGAASGVLATHLLYKCRIESILADRSQHREAAILKRLDRKLDLNERQKEQVRAILRETHEEIRVLRRKLRPESDAIIEKSQTRISAVLTPEQREIYGRIIAERRENIRKRQQ